MFESLNVRKSVWQIEVFPLLSVIANASNYVRGCIWSYAISICLKLVVASKYVSSIIRKKKRNRENIVREKKRGCRYRHILRTKMNNHSPMFWIYPKAPWTKKTGNCNCLTLKSCIYMYTLWCEIVALENCVYLFYPLLRYSVYGFVTNAASTQLDLFLK